MSFNPWTWLPSAFPNGSREPRRQFAAGLVVAVLAWLIVWWNHDPDNPLSTDGAGWLHWLATVIGLALFWGSGLLIFRSLTTWGMCRSWVRRCGTIEGLALVSAASLTLLAILLRWFWAYLWMVAALVAAWILLTALGWNFPKGKDP